MAYDLDLESNDAKDGWLVRICIKHLRKDLYDTFGFCWLSVRDDTGYPTFP